VRDHILGAGPIQWKVAVQTKGEYTPAPALGGHTSLVRLFAARAFMKTRKNDASAWDDLHAAWILARGLFDRPELISQLTAMFMARVINATAAKIPLPAPAWLAEMKSLDYRRRLAAAHQFDAWRHRLTYFNVSDPPLLWRHGPWLRMSAADTNEQTRVRVAELLRARSCDLATTRSGASRSRSPPGTPSASSPSPTNSTPGCASTASSPNAKRRRKRSPCAPDKRHRRRAIAPTARGS
jgi:hypothetical protein